MKALVVLNGQYYAGKNDQDNKLIFELERAKAVPVDDEGLKFIVQTVAEWVVDNEIELKRLEILRKKSQSKVTS
ncbi:hypothetical protein [Desulfosporosinus sp. SB140]|uniref:hypothetical protein n=1 Tax=Desulfosporosinus paludis TaxID=3115649 RepID=UPI00388EC04A